MEIVSDNPAARWLPSRHRFALTRLIAFIVSHVEDSRPRLSNVSRPRLPDVDHLLLAIDRDQSAVETYAISIWVLVASICYAAAVLPLPAAWAIVLAIPIAAFLLQLPIPFGATSAILMLIQFCAAAYFATASGPVHYVAWLSLTIFVMNAVAWTIDRACGI